MVMHEDDVDNNFEDVDHTYNDNDNDNDLAARTSWSTGKAVRPG